MTVLRNEGQWDKSNADFDGERVTRYSKTEGDFEWIDYGLSILTREVAGEIPDDEPQTWKTLRAAKQRRATRRVRGDGTLLRNRLDQRTGGAGAFPQVKLTPGRNEDKPRMRVEILPDAVSRYGAPSSIGQVAQRCS